MKKVGLLVAAMVIAFSVSAQTPEKTTEKKCCDKSKTESCEKKEAKACCKDKTASKDAACTKTTAEKKDGCCKDKAAKTTAVVTTEKKSE